MSSSSRTQTKLSMGQAASSQWCVRHLTAEKRLDCAYTVLPTSIQFANPEVGT